MLDVNDRSLRYIVTGLGAGNGVPRKRIRYHGCIGAMAILCLASDLMTFVVGSIISCWVIV